MDLRYLGIVSLGWTVELHLSPPPPRDPRMGQADRPRLTSQPLQATVPAVYAHIRGGRFAQRRPLLWPLVEGATSGLLPVVQFRLQRSRQPPEECLAGRNLHVVTMDWALLAAR